MGLKKNIRNKDSNSAIKLLLIIEIIKRYSDINNKLTSNDIDNYVNRSDTVDPLGHEFKVDTKDVTRAVNEYNTIYKDSILIEKKGKMNTYYYNGNDLSVMEAKAICDLVYSSDFFTKETKDIYKEKIKNLFSIHNSKYFDKKIEINIKKNANDAVLYRELEIISEAICKGYKINFTYKKPSLTERYKKEYTLVPIDTHFVNNTYYLLCRNEYDENKYLTYRLDYISNVSIIEDKPVDFTSDQIEQYLYTLKKSTSMYQKGVSDTVILEFDESVYANIIDKFGKEIKVTRCDNGKYTISVQQIINSTFYGWIVDFDGLIQIAGDEKQVQAFQEFIKKFIKD